MGWGSERPSQLLVPVEIMRNCIMQFRIIEAGPCQGEARRVTVAPAKTALLVSLGSS